MQETVYLSKIENISYHQEFDLKMSSLWLWEVMQSRIMFLGDSQLV